MHDLRSITHPVSGGRDIRPPSRGEHGASQLVHHQQRELVLGYTRPFWEDSRRFNRELAAFAARCW
jgi:non-heme chloroperoxidase